MEAWDFRRILAENVFLKGEVLFTVFAQEEAASKRLWERNWSPEKQRSAWWKGNGFSFEEGNEDPEESKYLGKVILDSKFVASSFGDQIHW